MNQVCITVNGETVSALIEPRMHLADFLRDHLRLTGTHLGCEHGVCGACTVLLNNEPARSCITFAVACDQQEVRTIEGFESDDVMAELREAFSREHALQCGFCTPAMLIAARDLVLRLPDADERRIRVEMSGNLCRCTGYLGIVRALNSVIDGRRTSTHAARSVPPQQERAVSFTPFTLSDTPQPAVAAAGFERPNNRIEEAFVVDHPLDCVWSIFSDMPAVASCLPGAEISEHTPVSVKGKITTKLGPMRAVFHGAASLKRDESAKRGEIRGGGTDSLSGSRARGEISYGLSYIESKQTRVTVSIDYSLQGPLAQFSRGGLVNEFVRRIIADFARNLSAYLAGDTKSYATRSSKVRHINAGGLFLRWLWSRIKAQFRA